MIRPYLRLPCAVALLLLAPALVRAADAPSSASAYEDELIPSDVRSELEGVLQDKVKALRDEKDKTGQPYRRGSFSKFFHKVDEDTYQVAFHRDSAGKDRLLTERFLLTLKRNGSKWTIASEDLKDSYDGLTRLAPGEEEFYRFDSVAFDREGMKVSCGPGHLVKASRAGKTEYFAFAGSGLQYEYLPPTIESTVEPRKYQQLYEKLKRDHASEVLFEPDLVTIECDPQSCEDMLATFKGLAAGTMESLEPRLRNRYDDAQKVLRKARKDNPFSGFQLVTPDEHRYLDLQIHKTTPERRVGLAIDNYEMRPVSYSAYGFNKDFPRYETIYHYDLQADRDKKSDPYQLEMRDDPDARDYDLTGLKGTAEFAVVDAETLSADLYYTLKTKRALRELPFFVSRLRQTDSESRESKAPQLIVNGIQDGNGRDMTWVKLGPSFGYIILPEKVPANTTLTVRLQFENRAGIYALTPTFSFVSRFGWMPFVRFTDMINDFHLTLRVRERYKPLGIGRVVSEKVEKGVRITEYVADSPVEFPSVIFGDYLGRESTFKTTKSDGSAIPVHIYVDKLGKVPGAEKMLEEIADQAAHSLEFYKQVYGVDYPYGKLDLVNDPVGPGFYGQSPSSLIYLGNGVFLSSGSAGALLESGTVSKFNREVVPHEVGHQWWGSLIPNHNNGNYWFVESLAEYSAALYVEAAEGPKAYQDKVAEWRRRVLVSDLQSSVQDASVTWAGNDTPTRGSVAGYIAAVYNKGPYAFHIMRMTWGLEKFKALLKSMTQNLKNRAIVTRDLQRETEKAFGGNMEFFFDQWLRGVGLPEYTFVHATRTTENQKTLLEGEVDQRTLVGLKKDVLDGVYFTAVVPITVTGRSGKEYRIPLKVAGPKTPFKFPLPEEPKEIVFNKYGESLAYDVIYKKLD